MGWDVLKNLYPPTARCCSVQIAEQFCFPAKLKRPHINNDYFKQREMAALKQKFPIKICPK